MQLVVDSVAMSFGDRCLFQNLSFTVAAGESVAIMGPSGSGKSTLIGAIAGLLDVEAGDIRYESSPRPPTTHWLFQSTPLLAHRSAVDNVSLVAESRGIDRDTALSSARGLLAQFGLADSTLHSVFRLSGGEKQRVAVARALLSEADLILADEPTASLDPISRAYVMSALGRAAEDGAMVVIATHDQWVADHCTRIIELSASAQ